VGLQVMAPSNLPYSAYVPVESMSSSASMPICCNVVLGSRLPCLVSRKVT